MKRFSAQRQAVLEAVCSTKSHPTADMIYEEVRKIIPKVSLGTGYRNLADLNGDGNIVGFTDSSGVEHFDATTLPHIHFQCTECGKVIDVPTVFLDEEASKTLKELDAEVSGALFLYFGKCSECKNKN